MAKPNKKNLKIFITTIVLLVLFYSLSLTSVINGRFNLETIINFGVLAFIVFSFSKNKKNRDKIIKMILEKQNLKGIKMQDADPVLVKNDLEEIMESIVGKNLAGKISQNIPDQKYQIKKDEYVVDILKSKNDMRLNRKKRYLQVALNGTLNDALLTINTLPVSEKIIIEAGTPLIKIHGAQAVRAIRSRLPFAYIVADIKIADLAEREVETFKNAGANAVTALGVAPLETLNQFVLACKKYNVDAMIDMMNVPSAIEILKKMSALPEVVILHRGVDETEKTKGKSIPYYQINQIKGQYNLIVSVAGGDTPKEIQSAVFNGANVVVVWKNFETGQSVKNLAENFLKEIK